MPCYTHKMAHVISPYIYNGARLARTPQQRRTVFIMLQIKYASVAAWMCVVKRCTLADSVQCIPDFLKLQTMTFLYAAEENTSASQ